MGPWNEASFKLDFHNFLRVINYSLITHYIFSNHYYILR